MPCVELKFLRQMWEHVEYKKMLNKIWHFEFKLDVWVYVYLTCLLDLLRNQDP
jgi:hypothetical protein